MRHWILVLALLLVACGAAAERKPAATPNPAREKTVASPEMDRDADGIPDAKDELPADTRLAGPAQAAPPPPPQKPDDKSPKTEQRQGAYLIYTAHLTMAVYQVEGALSQVERIGRDVGGYL